MKYKHKNNTWGKQLLRWKPHSIRFFLSVCCVSWGKVLLRSPGWPWAHYEAQAGTNLVIFLPPPFRGCDCKCVPPRMACETCDICDTALLTAWILPSRSPEPSRDCSAVVTEWHFTISSLFSNPQKPPFHFLLGFDCFESRMEKKSYPFALLWQAYSPNSSQV